MIKPLEELTFQDDFIFNRVMQSEKLCKRCIEMILGIEIDHVERVERERSMRPLYDSKGIRLDVYLKDSDAVYNVEMQNRIYRELPKRSRYYQSVMDVETLLRGEDYAKLRKNIVIFICTNDPFDSDQAVYTFENRCVEDLHLPLRDGTLKVFLNASGPRDGLSDGLTRFLDYVATGRSEDDYTRQLDNAVRNAKTADDARGDYMFFTAKLMDEHREGFEEGVETGRETRDSEIAQRMHAKGKSTNEIAEVLDLTTEKVQDLLKEK